MIFSSVKNYTVSKYKCSERQSHLNCQNPLTDKKVMLLWTSHPFINLYIKIDQFAYHCFLDCVLRQYTSLRKAIFPILYNSIYCNGCKLWMHKKCCGLQPQAPNPDYRCARCMANAHPIDGRPQSEVQVWPDKLQVVASFCYLGVILSAGGGCEMVVTTRVKTAWKKFR